MSEINIILGTMTFGEQLFEQDVENIIHRYLEFGFNELDTAYVYNNGESEKIIGSILKGIERSQIKIASKVHPRITGKLDANAVRTQLKESLLRLKLDYIDTYYLHFPDKNTPIESALEAVDKYYRQGLIKEWGISNFPVWFVKEIIDLSKKNGWILPTVYEGLYNPLSRKAETELIPFLRANKIRFNAYNPLAGGLLTDKYRNFFEKPIKGRFTFRPNYQERYWKKVYFEAVDLLKQECKQYDMSITEAAFRWMAHSSKLSANQKDGIIIGISNIQHLVQNIKFIEKGKLPENFGICFDRAWDICKDESPEYYRFFGK